MQLELTLKNLGELKDGKLAVAFQQAMTRIVGDMMDRPGVNKPRKLTMMIATLPVLDEDGDLGTVDVQVQMKESYPDRSTGKVRMAPRRNGSLVWNELSLTDPEQRTIDEVYPEAETVETETESEGEYD
jgi:hypothetical protein